MRDGCCRRYASAPGSSERRTTGLATVSVAAPGRNQAPVEMVVVEMAEHDAAPTYEPARTVEVRALLLEREWLVRERARDEHATPSPSDVSGAVHAVLHVCVVVA